MLNEIPAEWLPVRCETNRPSGPMGWTMTRGSTTRTDGVVAFPVEQ